MFRVPILPQKSQKIFWVGGFGHGSVGLYETTILLCPALSYGQAHISVPTGPTEKYDISNYIRISRGSHFLLYYVQVFSKVYSHKRFLPTPCDFGYHTRPSTTPVLYPLSCNILWIFWCQIFCDLIAPLSPSFPPGLTIGRVLETEF